MARLTPERRTEAAPIIKKLLEPWGCLQTVLASRLAARGFTPDEIQELLDRILDDHGYFPAPYEHPILRGQVSYTRLASIADAFPE
jgi:hypothetical protein